MAEVKRMRSPTSPAPRSRSLTRCTSTGPIPVSTTRPGAWPRRTTRSRPSGSCMPFIRARNASASASMACESSRRAPLLKTVVSGSSIASICRRETTVLFIVMGVSLLREVQAGFHPPRYAALLKSPSPSFDHSSRVTMGIRNNRYDAEVPTVTGPLRRKQSVHGFEAAIARSHTRRRLKFTLPGPMTIVDTIADEHYGDKVALAMAFAALLNEEARELAAIGVDVVQFDEPAFNVYMKEVTEWGIAALHRAAEGLRCKTAVHICYVYVIKVNIDWKATLGTTWLQYDAIF